MQFYTSSKIFKTLLISSLLLLVSTPAVSASEHLPEEEMAPVEEHDLQMEGEEEVVESSPILLFEAEDSIGEEDTDSGAYNLDNETDLGDANEFEGEEEETSPSSEEDLELDFEPAPEPVSEPGSQPILEPEPELEVDSQPDPEQASDPLLNLVPEESGEGTEIEGSGTQENSEPEPTPTIEPKLEPNPIEPKASAISGSANPGAHVIVVYPGTSRERATTVNSDGSWVIRNVGGDRAYLTEGARVPVQLLLTDNGQEYTYSYEFEVGDNTATDLIAESQMVYVTNETETASVEHNSSSGLKDSPIQTEEEEELLPPTGEAGTPTALALVSIAAGVGLFGLDTFKRKRV